MTAQPFIEHGVTSRELVSEVFALAIGGNPRDWPGMLFYRFVPARRSRWVSISVPFEGHHCGRLLARGARARARRRERAPLPIDRNSAAGFIPGFTRVCRGDQR